MGSNRFITLTMVTILLPTVAMAKEYIVGDDSGWTANFDYQAWAKDKVFHVNDTLVFRYTAPNHNVLKVNATEFNDCKVTPSNNFLSTGNDKITLSTPGNKWYICGKGSGGGHYCCRGCSFCCFQNHYVRYGFDHDGNGVNNINISDCVKREKNVWF